MNAKPALKMDALVFWFVIVTAVPALSWHFGFEAGFERGRSTSDGVCKITCEAKQ